MNKHNLNDVIVFIHGTQVIKGIIDEYILHHTQTKVIVKYIIRPYGLKDFVTIDEDKIYDSFEKAKQFIINDVKDKYNKENIKRGYKEAKKSLDKKYKKDINEFDSNFKIAINTLQELEEGYYDDLEAGYQIQIKENVTNITTN